MQSDLQLWSIWLPCLSGLWLLETPITCSPTPGGSLGGPEEVFR